MSDFATVWQQYFTALDELAKATVVYQPLSSQMDTAFQFRSWDEVELIEDSFQDAESALRDAQERFYEAHLALKPFLEDDSE